MSTEEHLTTRTPKQVVRRYLDALLAGDVDTIRDSFNDKASWTIHGDLPIAGPWHGRDRIVDDFLGTVAGALFEPGSQSFEFPTLIADGDTVALEWRVHARTARGADYDNDYCGIFVTRDGRIDAVREYLDSSYAARTLFDGARKRLKIGVVGAGRIGGGLAPLLAPAGHELRVSFARDAARLEALAAEVGGRVGSPAEAAAFGEVVVLSVPWPLIDDVLAQTGPLDGRIVIDTTNQFAAGRPVELDGRTAAQVNQERMPGARLVKAFNTLTAGFQAQTAGRIGPDRVVMFTCGDDADAKAVAADLVRDAGFEPFDLGGLADSAPMEPPRRAGAVYGEEIQFEQARRRFAR